MTWNRPLTPSELARALIADGTLFAVPIRAVRGLRRIDRLLTSVSEVTTDELLELLAWPVTDGNRRDAGKVMKQLRWAKRQRTRYDLDTGLPTRQWYYVRTALSVRSDQIHTHDECQRLVAQYLKSWPLYRTMHRALWQGDGLFRDTTAYTVRTRCPRNYSLSTGGVYSR